MIKVSLLGHEVYLFRHWLWGCGIGENDKKVILDDELPSWIGQKCYSVNDGR